MPPTISVLITYYNERELLTECLRSLLEQGPAPEEIIIYDDASYYPASNYVQIDVPVRIIRGATTIRPACGRNLLLHEARFDYVHFHDTDDLFLSGWLPQVTNKIRTTAADLVLTEVSTFSEGRLVSERVLGLDRIRATDDLVEFALQGAILTSSGVILRKAALTIGGFRETLHQAEDFDFYVRLAASGVTAAVLTEPIIRKENRADSYSSREQGVVWASVVDAVRQLADELPARYRSNLADKAAYAGSQLFKLGARHTASEAFQLARHLGPPTYARQRRSYRLLASALGPEAAEWISLGYRRLLPEPLRRALVQRGL